MKNEKRQRTRCQRREQSRRRERTNKAVLASIAARARSLASKKGAVRAAKERSDFFPRCCSLQQQPASHQATNHPTNHGITTTGWAQQQRIFCLCRRHDAITGSLWSVGLLVCPTRASTPRILARGQRDAFFQAPSKESFQFGSAPSTTKKNVRTNQ